MLVFDLKSKGKAELYFLSVHQTEAFGFFLFANGAYQSTSFVVAADNSLAV